MPSSAATTCATTASATTAAARPGSAAEAGSAALAAAHATRLRISTRRGVTDGWLRAPLLNDLGAHAHRTAAECLPSISRRIVPAVEFRHTRAVLAMNRLAEAAPAMRRACSRADGGLASAKSTRRGLAEISARNLLHASLLLLEGGVLHARRLHTAGEALRPRLRISSAGRAIGKV